MESAQFSRFEENLRPVWRLWELCRSKMRFGQNVLRMTWKERFVQFTWKAHCFPVLKRIWGQFHDFDNFDAQKCDLAKTCCAWPRRVFCRIFIKSALCSLFGENLRPARGLWDLCRSKMRFGQNVLRVSWKERFVQFSWKAHCFPVLARIWDNVTIFRSLALKNAIWPKRAAHDLKRAFCTIFMESALFSLFEENLRPVWRLWELCRSKMRFGQNVLRMTWKERFVEFSWKGHCVAFLERIWDKCNDF